MTQKRVEMAALAAVCLLWAAPAAAQTWETVGIRAQGMAGAFVAVADDASAAWWNPAGIASGAFFNAVLERGRTTDPGADVGLGPAWRGESSGFAVAFPALGLSYYRLRISEIAPAGSTETEAGARQDEGAGALGTVELRTLGISQFGVTTGQSIGRHLVVASTLKLLRAGRTAVVSVGEEDALDEAADLDESRSTHAGLDVGAMVSVGRTRFGLSVRNLNEPSFGEGDAEFELERQARAGVAVVTGPAALIDGVSLAVDADITTTDTVHGDSRRVAAGAEAWLLRRRIGVRGGVSVNTLEEHRTAASAGLSLAPRAGVYLDGALTFGSDDSREGWSFGVRFSY